MLVIGIKRGGHVIRDRIPPFRVRSGTYRPRLSTTQLITFWKTLFNMFLLLPPAGWPLSRCEQNQEGRSIPTTAWQLQILVKKNREKRRAPATIPRPSFTNYTEYLLTGGLSQCLLSHPTPPHLFNIPTLSIPLCYRKLLAPPGEEIQTKRRMKSRSRNIVESLASRLFRFVIQLLKRFFLAIILNFESFHILLPLVLFFTTTYV